MLAQGSDSIRVRGRGRRRRLVGFGEIAGLAYVGALAIGKLGRRRDFKLVRGADRERLAVAVSVGRLGAGDVGAGEIALGEALALAVRVCRGRRPAAMASLF